jgi:hypothetical protein
MIPARRFSEAEKVAELDEDQLAVSVARTGLIEDRGRGQGLIERQIAEAVGVADIEGGTGVQQVGQQYVGGECLGGRERTVG